MGSQHDLYPDKIDVSNCDKEPIHIIGKSQSHGVIVVCDPESLQITQLGENTEEHFRIKYPELLDKNLSELLGLEQLKKFKEYFEANNQIPEEVEINERRFLMLAHRSEQNLILEFEPPGIFWDSLFFQRQLIQIVNNLNAAKSTRELCEEAARLTREIFEYDRVMVYKFDEEWNGEVIAEEKREEMESWLGLHYPASDIPSQSRALFLKHPVRIIADVNYKPINIHPEISPLTKKPLDLSKAELRAVSPIHIEYLQNMKVGASLTAAIIANGKLWGLLACHHNSAKFINYYQRETCKFLTQIFSNQLSLKESQNYRKQWEKSSEKIADLLSNISKTSNIFQGVTGFSSKFTDVINAEGGAIVLDGDLALLGKTPDEEKVKQLISEFISEQEGDIFFTKQLDKQYLPAEDFRKNASGLLSVRLGRNKNHYLLWFRPEKPQSVSWGGNAENKVTYNEKEKRLSPRKSFEKWTQKLTGVSESWKDFEIDAARELGKNLNSLIVEKQKDEISRLNHKLMKIVEELELFSYSISHDLRGPLRGVQGFAQILKEDHFQELSSEGQEVVETILNSAKKMDILIEDILSLSKISTGNIVREKIDVAAMINDLLESLNLKVNYPKTRVIIDENLASMDGDRKMMYQVWSNLIGNALKYSAKEPKPVIEIGSFDTNGKTAFFVRDNGIGVEKKDEELVFKAFKRAAGKEYSGSGIGLAVVKRIIEKHQGKIWFEPNKNKGVSFYFYI